MLASILINNYNYEKYLETAIRSALDQTYNRVEVVVVDDGSVDGSRQIIEQFGDRIVSVFKLNGGQASAINAGFAACQGEVILLLDADDYFYPNKVQKVISLFKNFSEIGWFFHKLDEVDSYDELIERPHRRAIQDYAELNLKSSMLAGKPITHWLTATSGLCFRRRLFGQIVPLSDSIRISADSFIRLAALYLSPGILSPDCLAVHRKHGDNLYDFKPDIAVERMKLGIQTAYYLQQKFPELHAFTHRQFAFCLGRLIEYSTFKTVFQMPEVKLYLGQDKSPYLRLQLAAYVFKGLLNRANSEQRKK